MLHLDDGAERGHDVGMPELKCCHLEDGKTLESACPKAAEWEIFYGPTFHPYDSSHACSDHLGHLLSDAEEHRIFPISMSIEKPATTEASAL